MLLEGMRKVRFVGFGVARVLYPRNSPHIFSLIDLQASASSVAHTYGQAAHRFGILALPSDAQEVLAHAHRRRASAPVALDRLHAGLGARTVHLRAFLIGARQCGGVCRQLAETHCMAGQQLVGHVDQESAW